MHRQVACARRSPLRPLRLGIARGGGPRSGPARWLGVPLAAALAVLVAGCAGSAPPANAPTAALQAPTVHALARPLRADGVTVQAAAPVVLHSPAAQSCSRLTARPGWLARENSRPGTWSFRLPSAAWAGLSGYLDASSVQCGESVDVHLSGSGVAQVRAYRIGWYGGAGARLVWTSAWLSVHPRRFPGAIGVANLVEPRWPSSLRIGVDGRWVPGFYLLVPVDAAGQPGTPMPLVVRDDSGHEPLLVAASDLTWAAYDEWGGWSLYHGPLQRRMTQAARFASRARVVSLQRPLTGSGYIQLTAYDLPLVRFVERLGLDAAYTTDSSIDAWPGQLLDHSALVLGGHDEYWTTRMYDAIDAARAAGVNLAFLGANTAYWHARLESGPGGPASHLAVWRVLGQDPKAGSDPKLATVKWDEPPLSRPRVGILGQGYAGIQVRGGFQVRDAPAWLLAGTGLRDGSLLPGAVGNEADGWDPSPQTPANDQTVLAGVLTGAHGPVTVSANYYSSASGAGVFAAGTTAWSCELGAWCPYAPAPASTLRAVQAITANVLRAFSLPRAGARYPAHATAMPTPVLLLGRLPRAAVGSYGVGGSEGAIPARFGAPQPSAAPRGGAARAAATPSSSATPSGSATASG